MNSDKNKLKKKKTYNQAAEKIIKSIQEKAACYKQGENECSKEWLFLNRNYENKKIAE